MQVLGQLAGNHTIYTCLDDYSFPNGLATKNITCDPTGRWDSEIDEGCAGNHLRYHRDTVLGECPDN